MSHSENARARTQLALRNGFTGPGTGLKPRATTGRPLGCKPGVLGSWVLVGLLAGCGASVEPDRATELTVSHDLAAALTHAEVTTETLGVDLLQSGLGLVGEGWSPRNANDHRWSLGAASEARFSVVHRRPLELRLEALPFVFPGSPEQTLAVELNGQPAGTLELARQRGTYRVLLPADALTPGENRLRFVYGYHRPPSEVLDSRDTRSLAVGWFELRVEDPTRPVPVGPSPMPRVSEALDRLALPAGSQVDYYFEVGRRAELSVAAWNPRGATLEVLWQTEGGEQARVVGVDASDHATRVPLPPAAGDGTTLARLRLRTRGVPGTADNGAFVLVRPTLSSSVAASPPEPLPPSPSPATESDRRRPNVLVYMIDTLRADHLGCYGYSEPTSPRIDAFADEAVLFENAVAQSSWTRSSVASLLTGLAPTEHGALRRRHKLPDDTVGLAEILRDAGWQTGAFVTNPNVTPAFGFDQGFEHFSDLGEAASASAVNDAVVRWLREQRGAERPFFLYVHTLDPHDPYAPPADLVPRFDADSPFRDSSHAHKTLNDFQAGRRGVDDRLLEGLRALYDAEIAANDRAFGELMDVLERQGLYDSTWIVVVSDHGEEFNDHGHFRHGKALFGESVDVPLIVKPPGHRDGRRVAEPVQHIDFLPTLLAELGLAAPGALPGRHLLRPLEPAPIVSYLHLDGPPRASVLDRGWKLIVRRAGERFVRTRLFHLPSDPGERDNLAGERPIRTGYLTRLLRVHLATGRASEEVTLDTELRRRLEALGYLE